MTQRTKSEELWRSFLRIVNAKQWSVHSLMKMNFRHLIQDRWKSLGVNSLTRSCLFEDQFLVELNQRQSMAIWWVELNGFNSLRFIRKQSMTVQSHQFKALGLTSVNKALTSFLLDPKPTLKASSALLQCISPWIRRTWRPFLEINYKH